MKSKNKNNIVVIQRQIRIMLQIPLSANLFLSLKEAFNKEKFNIYYVDANNQLIPKTAQFSADFDDRTDIAYFSLNIMASDEEKFYDLLKKFCEKTEFSFKDPRKKNIIRQMYAKIKNFFYVYTSNMKKKIYCRNEGLSFTSTYPTSWWQIIET